MKKRIWISLLCCLLILCCTGCGTVPAYPGDVSEPVITPAAVPIILYAGDEPAGPLALTQEQQDLLRQAALADKQTQALESLVSQRRSNYTIETHPEWLTVSS